MNRVPATALEWIRCIRNLIIEGVNDPVVHLSAVTGPGRRFEISVGQNSGPPIRYVLKISKVRQ